MYNLNDFIFSHNGDVLVETLGFIGRIEADGYLSLQEEFRTEDMAEAVHAALVQQYPLPEFAPALGWMPEHYLCVKEGASNV